MKSIRLIHCKAVYHTIDCCEPVSLLFVKSGVYKFCVQAVEMVLQSVKASESPKGVGMV